MEFLTRLRRALRAAKAPLYTDLGTTVAEAASNVSIATGISGGAPLPKEKKADQLQG
ncbi:hypothetical protein [Catenulispora sp. GP43]|uniref:hypothetical protein n=1 Tax=Catenulispora sp. GP43 TaxID=3156263 RepID=UPI003511B9F0